MFTIFTFSTPRRIGIVLSSVHTLAMGSILQVHFSVQYYEKKYNLSHNLKIGFCKKKIPAGMSELNQAESSALSDLSDDS